MDRAYNEGVMARKGIILARLKMALIKILMERKWQQ